MGDTVLDPFAGTGTTSVAAALWGRNSIGFEIDETYLAHAAARFSKDTSGLFNQTKLTVQHSAFDGLDGRSL